MAREESSTRCATMSQVTHDPSRDAIGDYLRRRRSELRPVDVGLPPDGNPRRRAPGLRREEVAELASLSADYYTRIEQGRRRAPAETLAQIARVLMIDDDGLRYLTELSRTSPAAPASADDPVPPTLLEVLDGMTGLPAIVLGRRMDIHAANTLARRLLQLDLDELAPERRNYARLLFAGGPLRALYPEWEQTGRACVFQLHIEMSRLPEDQALADLVEELSAADEDFRTWWTEHQVVSGDVGSKAFRHPLVGEFTLDWTTLSPVPGTEHRLIVWSPGGRPESIRRLEELAQLPAVGG